MSPFNLEISNRYPQLEAPAKMTRRLFGTILQSGKFPIAPGELSVAFVDDEMIAQIHADFMGDPSPTDVITFPADVEMESAGEIIVSVDHARSRAADLGEPFGRELALYLVHGWLHLAGYDDRSEVDRGKMRRAEQEALALLGTNPEAFSYRLKNKP